MGRVLKRGWAGLGYSGCLDMYPEPGINIDLSSDVEYEVIEDGVTLAIDASMGVCIPQDRFLKHLYDIMLPRYRHVIPTARRGGNGIHWYVNNTRFPDIVEIHKAKKEANVYKIKIPRELLRQYADETQNRVYVTSWHRGQLHLGLFFDVRAEDRDQYTQVIRIQCTDAEFNYLTGAGANPETGMNIQTVLHHVWLLFNSLHKDALHRVPS